MLTGAFIGYLGWSVLWLGLILYLLSAFAYGEIERLRGVLRAEAHKESMMLILSSQSESVEWLNHILERFWIVYSPDLCKSIGTC